MIAHQAPDRVEAELQAARAGLAEAEANLSLAQVTQRRYETLIEQRSAPQQELDQAVVQVEQAKAVRDNSKTQLAQAQLTIDESRLVSPIDGVLAVPLEALRFRNDQSFVLVVDPDSNRTITLGGRGAGEGAGLSQVRQGVDRRRPVDLAVAYSKDDGKLIENRTTNMPWQQDRCVWSNTTCRYWPAPVPL